VLVFDGGPQLEIAWQKWDDLSITCDTIDLSVPPDALGWNWEWRESQPAELAAVASHVITGYATIEKPYFSGDVDLQDPLPPIESLPVQGWSTAGLWIEFGDAGLLVENGIDENRLRDNPSPYEKGWTRVVPLP
jgi:hypothetical protein